MLTRILAIALAIIGLIPFLTGCEDDSTLCEPCENCTDDTQWREIHRPSGQYINHRFFFPDLARDWPGRDRQTEFIDPASIQLFRLMGPGLPSPQDVQNMAAYVDESGRWQDIDFQQPQYYGFRWQMLDWDLRANIDGELENLDLRESLPLDAVVGIVYRVINQNGDLVFKVGDIPGFDEDDRINLPGETESYYRIKLLKGDAVDQYSHPFNLVRRNVYDIGTRSINIEGLDLKIEWNAPGTNLDVDEMGLSYVQIFGLDSQHLNGTNGSDGIPDFHDGLLFDLRKGLLFFPLSFSQPFASSEVSYSENADSDLFVWSGSYLQMHQTPQIYDLNTFPHDYSQYSPFVLKFFIRLE